MRTDDSIECLPNLGPKSIQWLRAVGINTISDLQSVGAVNAYQLVREQQPKASLNLLWAMVAGLKGKDWRELTEATKMQLKQSLLKLGETQ